MITTSQLVHPDLSLPVRRIHLLAACTTFQKSPTLASSPYTISSSVDVDHFRLFVNPINGTPPDITDGNIADLSSLAAEFGFIQLLHEIDVHDPRFPVARSATWDREDVRKLIVNVPHGRLLGRDEIPTRNLTRLLGELAAYQSAEVHSTPDSTGGDWPPIGPARRSKIEGQIERETIETLRDLNSKFQTKIDILTSERHIFVKENDKLRVVALTTKQEYENMKSDNQILLEERKQLISINTKWKSDEQNLRELNAKFQAKIDVLTTERQNFVKENNKLCIICQTAVDENVKMKGDNQVLLEERQRLISMNTKLTADQRTCQKSMRSWQSDADKLQDKIDRMASGNERLYSVNRQLMEVNEVLAVNRQNL
jgi:hypothetical protein